MSVKGIFTLLFSFVLITGFAQSSVPDMTGDFYSPRILRELNFFVATHPSYATNHFCVAATELDRTNMISGLVYWKEDQMLLDYSELETNAPDDFPAWPNRQWKLGRDTVKTENEINGSDYLITVQQWHGWVDQCASKGKSYVVLTASAQRIFPNAKSKSSQ